MPIARITDEYTVTVETIDGDEIRRHAMKLGREWMGSELRGPLSDLGRAAEVVATPGLAGPWTHKADAVAWCDELYRELVED